MSVVTCCSLLSTAMMLFRVGGIDDCLNSLEGRAITARVVVATVEGANLSSSILFSRCNTKSLLDR